MTNKPSKLGILICDDIESRAKSLREKLGAKLGNRADVASLAANELEQELRDVSGLVRTAIGPASAKEKKKRTRFDSSDIVFIDNNLVKLFQDQAITTAETFVGQIIAFCNCSFVGVLNRQPDVAFDLRLKRDKGTDSDLSLRAVDLLQDGLWSKEWDGFRPWYWPYLAHAAVRRKAQIKSLHGHLDDGVLKFFDFNATARTLLGDSLAEIFPQSASGDLTFRQFFEHHAKSLEPQSRKKLKESDEVVARVVAAEISAWLHYDVLMRQEVLTDAPHLALNDGTLMKQVIQLLKSGPAQQIEKVTEMVAKHPSYKKARFKKGMWLDRPAWWASELDKDGAVSAGLLSALARSDSSERVVFCEDASRFVRFADARPYHLSDHSLSGTRYIWYRAATKYVPRSDLMK